jgi:hypothetical protein
MDICPAALSGIWCGPVSLLNLLHRDDTQSGTKAGNRLSGKNLPVRYTTQ